MLNLRAFHILLGKILLIPILLVALTGILLGIGHPIQTCFPPYLLEHPSSNPGLPFESIERKLTSLFPGEGVGAIYLPAQIGQALRLKMYEGKKLKRTVFLDPGNGQITHVQSASEPSFLERINQFHRGSWAGVQGKVFMSSAGFLLLAFGPTGWLMRKRRLKGKSQPLWSKAYFRNRYGIHRFFGYTVGVIIPLMGVSGGLLNFYTELTQHLDPVPATRSIPTLRHFTLEEAMEAAKAANPTSRLQSVHWAKAPEHTILFYFENNSRVYLHQDTLETLKTLSPNKNGLHALFPLHSGHIFGAGAPVYSTIVGLLLCIIAISGISISGWIPLSQKRSRKRKT